jgi:Proteasomal ATPase OB C-terminal domain
VCKQTSGIVGSTTGSNYYVRILSTLNRELLKPSSSVALHRHSNALVDILPPEADSSISLLSQSERPDVTYQASDCPDMFVSHEGIRIMLVALSSLRQAAQWLRPTVFVLCATRCQCSCHELGQFVP